MADHSPEPWLQAGDVILCGDGPDIAQTTGYNFDANARRIVACVNACKALSTEWLESHDVLDYWEKNNIIP